MMTYGGLGGLAFGMGLRAIGNQAEEEINKIFDEHKDKIKCPKMWKTKISLKLESLIYWVQSNFG